MTDNCGGDATPRRQRLRQQHPADRLLHGHARTRPPIGATVTFDGSASSDPGGAIAKYEWDLDGNGTFETDTGTVATTTSTYTVRQPTSSS